MTSRRGRRRWFPGGLAAIAGFAAVTGCAGSDDSSDTLAPLPISVAVTTPTPGATLSPQSSSTVESTTETSTTSEVTDSPTLVGDWDGAEFDVGVIHGTGELGGYRTIDFDRYSYRDPELGVIDAAGFVEEPIAYGWAESPFVNIQEQLRTFVLADDVEVLVLGGAAAGRSCRDRRPLPPADWIEVGVSFLDRSAVSDDVASLTYSDDGLVTRIRFTRGCVG